MRRLLDEVKAGRDLIVLQRDELRAADAETVAEKQNTASLERLNTLAENQIEHLLKATDQLNQAIQLKSDAIGVLEQRNDQLKRDLKKTRKRVLWVSLAAGALGALLVIK
jgi:hypothetical protein